MDRRNNSIAFRLCSHGSFKREWCFWSNDDGTQEFFRINFERHSVVHKWVIKLPVKSVYQDANFLLKFIGLGFIGERFGVWGCPALDCSSD